MTEQLLDVAESRAALEHVGRARVPEQVRVCERDSDRMRRRRIIVALKKGGTGKSSVAAALGSSFSERGIETVVIDADSKKAGGNGQTTEWGELRARFFEGRGPRVGTLETWDVDELADLEAGSDVVVFDSTPRDEPILRELLLVVDVLVIPITYSDAMISGLEYMLKVAHEANDWRRKQGREALRIIVFPNKVRLVSPVQRETKPVIVRRFGEYLFPVELGFCSAMEAMFTSGMRPTDYARYASGPKCMRKLRDYIQEGFSVTNDAEAAE